jgi:hypothetical protein
MKNTLVQLFSYFNKFNHRQLQFAYFALMLVVSVVMRSPSDGGGGPY